MIDDLHTQLADALRAYTSQHDEPSPQASKAIAAYEAEKGKMSIGRFLCRIGLHRYRTNKLGYTYRCTRPGCNAFYQDAQVGRAISRALDRVDEHTKEMKL